MDKRGLRRAGRRYTGSKILASDVYEWAPGRFFVVHPAYGRIGDVGVGGVEIIGYDTASRKYRSHFFDSQGNSSVSELIFNGETWILQDARTRCTSGRWSSPRSAKSRRGHPRRS